MSARVGSVVTMATVTMMMSSKCTTIRDFAFLFPKGYGRFMWGWKRVRDSRGRLCKVQQTCIQ